MSCDTDVTIAVKGDKLSRHYFVLRRIKADGSKEPYDLTGHTVELILKSRARTLRLVAPVTIEGPATAGNAYSIDPAQAWTPISNLARERFEGEVVPTATSGDLDGFAQPRVEFEFRLPL